MIRNIPAGVQRLDLEVAAALAVFAVEQPAEGVIYRCLSHSIVSVDGCAAAVEVQLQVAASLKIFNFQGIQLQNH